jgi:hypothetical protein
MELYQDRYKIDTLQVWSEFQQAAITTEEATIRGIKGSGRKRPSTKMASGGCHGIHLLVS